MSYKLVKDTQVKTPINWKMVRVRMWSISIPIFTATVIYLVGSWMVDLETPIKFHPMIALFSFCLVMIGVATIKSQTNNW